MMGLQDWLDTVLEYLKVIAWPVVVLTLSLIYRKPLVGVLRRLHKAAGFGATVELEKSLEQDARALNEAVLPELTKSDPQGDAGAEKDAPSVETSETETVPPASTSGPPATAKSDWSAAATRAFWESNPEAAIRLGIAYPGDERYGTLDAERYGHMMLAWAHLESKAVRLGELIGLSPSPARNLGVLSGKLLDRGLISHEGAEIARSLQRLRNDLVHEVDNITISSLLTSDFVQTAEKLYVLFDTLIDTLEDAAEV